MPKSKQRKNHKAKVAQRKLKIKNAVKSYQNVLKEHLLKAQEQYNNEQTKTIENENNSIEIPTEKEQ